jgi:hypothetical protein
MTSPAGARIELERVEEGMTSGSGPEPDEPNGYRRLAVIMQKEENLAIFRRFQDINMLQLMSLQAEILHIQAWFKHRCAQDQAANPSYSSVFRDLRLSQLRPNVNSAPSAGSSATGIVQPQLEDVSSLSQYELLLKLRERMTEYS